MMRSWDPLEWRKPTTFTDEQIAAAVAAATALPAPKKSDPDKLDTPWAGADPMPTIAQLDFRDMTVADTDLGELLASNKRIDRKKLIWHIQHPGQARQPNEYTTNPLVLGTDDGQVIVDGHHRLFALQLLGQTSWPCAVMPSK